MKRQRWAVALHDFVLDPRSWLWICPALLIAGTFWYGDIRGGMIWALGAPMLFLGWLLIYGLADLAQGPAQTFATAAGFGALSLMPALDGEKAEPGMLALVFVASAGSVLLLKAIAVYVAPIWARSDR